MKTSLNTDGKTALHNLLKKHGYAEVIKYLSDHAFRDGYRLLSGELNKALSDGTLADEDVEPISGSDLY